MEYETNYVQCGGDKKLLGIKIRGVKNDERRPTHFILLLDTSGSMELNGRLKSVKNCVRYMLNFLNPDDRISIIRFSDNSDITVAFQATTVENRMIIERHIDSLTAIGSTNLSAGLLKVRDVMNNTNEMKTGLVILTDGFANKGLTDEESLRSLVGLIRQQNQNMSVSTIGYGTDHEAQLLRNIALEGGGSYNIITNEENVGDVFAEVLGGLVSCVAQNIEIVFPLGWKHCTGYVCSEKNNRKHLFIGDIYSQTEVIILLEQAGAELDYVQIRGFNCIDMKDYNNRVEWNSRVIRDEIPYRAYYVRWRIGNYLEGLTDNGEIRNELDTLEDLITSLGTGPMIDMLRSELITLRRNIDNPPSMDDSMNITQNIQRSAFLTTGRGGASQTVGDPSSPANRSLFLSPVQREISVAMTSARR